MRHAGKKHVVLVITVANGHVQREAEQLLSGLSRNLEFVEEAALFRDYSSMTGLVGDLRKLADKMEDVQKALDKAAKESE